MGSFNQQNHKRLMLALKMNESQSDEVGLPKIAVLMATYNGAPWLTEQIESILHQLDVDVTLYVSDDCSTDLTWSILTTLEKEDRRIVLLSNDQKFGNAGKNFYRLIKDVDIENYDYIAFSDQDDIWLPSKLISHVNLVRKLEVDAVSSNVTAFWEDGREELIEKSQPLRRWDYLFEAAGPGCTYLMTPRLVDKVRSILRNLSTPALAVSLHDWLSYAVCRSMGWGWHIDYEPSVFYRQHATNLLGANSGLKSKLARLKKLNNGWYRNEVLKVTEVCQHLNRQSEYLNIHHFLSSENYLNRLRIIGYISQSRRRPLDRLMLLASILIGMF
jgi:rhamnosyltransferase